MSLECREEKRIAAFIECQQLMLSRKILSGSVRALHQILLGTAVLQLGLMKLIHEIRKFSKDDILTLLP